MKVEEGIQMQKEEETKAKHREASNPVSVTNT